ncbi:MAG: GNAT family N-acetyltransferase [SAR202 cluster bacterium]|nr:GNAT family N-acetyltransferase [Dehalococcoidia bacterium]MQF88676.1 GNAT family N-acetyltransferase [SAR202 cluster bacterium]
MANTPITSFQDIESEWESVLQDSPADTLFLTPQWQKVWWDTFGDGRTMCGFSYPLPDGASGDGVAAIASLAKSGDTVSFMGSQDTFDYNDFPIRPGHEEGFYQTLLETMEEQDFRELRLDSLRESSPTLELFPEMARGRGFTVDIEQEGVTSGINLPATWDEYLGLLNKKDRHELRRKLRRMDSQTDWKWYSLTDAVEVKDRLGEFITLMRLSRTDKDEFMTLEREQFFYNITQRMAELGQLHLYFLDMDDSTVATSLCFDYGGSRLLYNSGYDPEYGYFSVGLLLNAMCLKDAIDRSLTYFDFLRGPEPYKAHLGGQQRSLYQMVVTKS